MKDHRPWYATFYICLSLCLSLCLSFTSRATGSPPQETAIPLQTTESQSVLIVNEDQEPHTLWILAPVSANGPREPEASFEVAPKAKLEISLKPWQRLPWVKLVSTSPALRLYHKIISSKSFEPWPWGLSNSLSIKRGLPHATLWIANLTGEEQAFTLTGEDNGARYLQGRLKPYESRSWVWRGSAGALKLEARYRVSAMILDALTKENMPFQPKISDFKQTLPATPMGASRFVLANPKGTQGFVVEIQDENLVREAREQLVQPLSRERKILVAEVGPGSSLNYDPLSPWLAPWSWQVKKVYRFADFGSLDCDGTPQLIEELLPWWLQARRGVICFWNFRIQAELP